jgi:hypothetical protein
MIKLIDIRNVCTICALEKPSFVIDKFCHDCWESMVALGRS